MSLRPENALTGSTIRRPTYRMLRKDVKELLCVIQRYYTSRKGEVRLSKRDEMIALYKLGGKNVDSVSEEPATWHDGHSMRRGSFFGTFPSAGISMSIEEGSRRDRSAC